MVTRVTIQLCCGTAYAPPPRETESAARKSKNACSVQRIRTMAKGTWRNGVRGWDPCMVRRVGSQKFRLFSILFDYKTITTSVVALRSDIIHK